MKMNNKGMTLVELIVTFSLLLILIVGLYNLILEIKFELEDKQIAKDLTEYSATMNNKIHYNMLKKEPFAIAYKNSKEEIWQCKDRNVKDKVGKCEQNSLNTAFVFKSESESETQSKSLFFSHMNNRDTDISYCSNIFPCAIYAYTDGAGEINFQTIALKIKDIEEPDSETNINGILYDGVLEPFPDKEYTETKAYLYDDLEGTEVTEEDKPSITFENNIFSINFPFFIIENDNNCGFKIAYPFTDIEQ